MARSLSPSLLGRQIDGIWHTGIVAFGRECYFGGAGGICDSPPSATPYGPPDYVYDLGYSEVPRELYVDFLNGLRERYTGAAYDLFENNCNTFTDEVSVFLTGNKIPSHITGLPSEVLSTPFGGMIRSMLLSYQQRMIPQTSPSTLTSVVPQINYVPEGLQSQSHPRPSLSAPSPSILTSTSPYPSSSTQEQQKQQEEHLQSHPRPQETKSLDPAFSSPSSFLQDSQSLFLTALSEVTSESERAILSSSLANPSMDPLPEGFVDLLSRICASSEPSLPSSTFAFLNQFLTILLSANPYLHILLTPSTTTSFSSTSSSSTSSTTILETLLSRALSTSSHDESLWFLRLALSLFTTVQGARWLSSPPTQQKCLELCLAHVNPQDASHVSASAKLTFNILLCGAQFTDPDQLLQIIVAFAHPLTELENIHKCSEDLTFDILDILLTVLKISPESAEVLQVTGFAIENLKNISPRIDLQLEKLQSYF